MDFAHRSKGFHHGANKPSVMSPRLSSENLLHNTIACTQAVIGDATGEARVGEIVVNIAVVSRKVTARLSGVFTECEVSALIKRQSHAAKRCALGAIGCQRVGITHELHVTFDWRRWMSTSCMCPATYRASDQLLFNQSPKPMLATVLLLQGAYKLIV